MENSFFEYRDQSGVEVESDSDTDIIEESFLEELMPKTPMKTPMRNNLTVVPDSDESLVYDGSDNETDNPQAPKTIIGSSDDEEVSPELLPKRRPPIRPKSLNTTTDSPVIRRVKKRMVLDSDSDNSIIIEKAVKSKVRCQKETPLKIDGGKDGKVNDSDESCDETMDDGDDTFKIDQGKGDDEESDYEEEIDNGNDTNDSEVESDSSHNDKTMDEQGKDDKDDTSAESDDDAEVGEKTADDHDEEGYDEGPNEDLMVMSRATRMSIMGIIPKQNESDESDFIESDESVKPSIRGSTESLTDLPADVATNRTPLAESTRRVTEMNLSPPEDGGSLEDSDSDLPEVNTTRTPHKPKTPKPSTPHEGFEDSDSDLPEVNITTRTPHKPKTPKPLTPVKALDDSNNDSVLTCSPIQSPLRDVTADFNNSPKSAKKTLKDKVLNNLLANDNKTYYDGEVTVVDDGFAKPKSKITKNTYYDGEVTVVEETGKVGKENVREDEDVTVIESVPEVIMLSSDEEDELSAPKVTIKTSPKSKTSPKPKRENTMKKYLPPPSYPNQVVYVPKHILDRELSKLSGMQADLHNVKNLLDKMDVSTLPDGGSKLISRLTELEAELRRQGDKVGNMVVEPSVPTPADIARDGYDQGLSWDDLQKASNAVQPRMFGKQAMSSHLAERNLILERLRDLHSALATRPAEEKQAKAPAALKTELMPHQKHALAWLRWREGLNPHGGILADDMGLGKTITMISLIAGDREIADDGEESDDDDDERSRGRLTKGGTLVVCPASLMTQWEGEVKKHCLPHRVTTVLHHGASRATQPQRLAHTDIVMTTYNILQRDSEKNGVLMRISWRRVILDEAHMVRNHKSATSRAVCGLRARRRWALTGTPLHNKDLDLFALLKFLQCTPFDDLAMWKKWIDNKSQGGQERLSTIMRCIMLRRTKVQLQAKGQLKDLPERTAHQCHVTLTKEEMNVYQKVLVFSKTLFAQFLHQRAEKDADGGFVPRGGQKDSAYYQMHKKMIALQGAKPVKAHEILVLLLRLRQVCCHCGLIAAMLDADDAGALEEDEGGKDLLAELNKLTLEDANKSNDNADDSTTAPGEEGTTVTEAIRSVLSPNNPVFQLTMRSSKIEAVMDCLKKNVLVNKGEKAVVVSQWTSVLSLVEAELKRERVRSVTLSGAVPVPARAALVAALNDPKSDVRIMLLSLCAGGVGLNLCGASHLLLLDPHWNPQLEEQAQDRIYRVGQTRPVHVYRFMCVDTVEQSIRKLQDAKLEMAANVLTGARHTSASKLSIEDLKVLFNMGQQ
ncbi:transcription termination factor 2 [Cydia pomonella]|uniref:transcription termination factor 2 n=1 Tax=Cydia pomonella TaxID=82600 RepID=UPI002ADE50FC|nr:transcription termination factor 2 [Cydia pomonella]